MRYCHLPTRRLLALQGPDRVDFLQGLLTNDVRKISASQWLYAALLTPQGKFLHDVFATVSGEIICIDIDQAGLEDFIKRLMLYKLRSKVAIEVLPPQQGIVALWQGSPDAAPSPSLQAFADPRFPALGWRMMGEVDDLKSRCEQQAYKLAPPDEYDAWRLSLGVPEGARDLKMEKSFPLDFGLDEINAVDFAKGCYVGQEVTARMKYRAERKKSLWKVMAAKPLPAAGTAILAAGEEIGELRSSQGQQGLALLRLDMLQKAQAENKALQADGIALEISSPAWRKNSI